MQDKNARCIVKFNDDGYVNIAADRIDKDECMVYAYYRNTLVGAFDISAVLAVYISGSKEV